MSDTYVQECKYCKQECDCIEGVCLGRSLHEDAHRRKKESKQHKSP